MAEVLRILAANWTLVANGVALTVMTTTSFYLITAYTPTYARAALHMAPNMVFLVTLLVGLSNLAWLPVGGIFTDRYGARPLMLMVTAAALLTAYPAMVWLVDAPELRQAPRRAAALFGLFRALQRRADPASGRDHAP